MEFFVFEMLDFLIGAAIALTGVVTGQGLKLIRLSSTKSKKRKEVKNFVMKLQKYNDINEYLVNTTEGQELVFNYLLSEGALNNLVTQIEDKIDDTKSYEDMVKKINEREFLAKSEGKKGIWEKFKQLSKKYGDKIFDKMNGLVKGFLLGDSDD